LGSACYDPPTGPLLILQPNEVLTSEYSVLLLATKSLGPLNEAQNPSRMYAGLD
jgi:hypothetical protein